MLPNIKYKHVFSRSASCSPAVAAIMLRGCRSSAQQVRRAHARKAIRPGGSAPTAHFPLRILAMDLPETPLTAGPGHVAAPISHTPFTAVR